MIYPNGRTAIYVPWIIGQAQVVEAGIDYVGLILWVYQPQHHPEDGTDKITFYKIKFDAEEIQKAPTGLVRKDAFAERTPHIWVDCDMDALIPWLENEGLLIELEKAADKIWEPV